MLTPLKIKEARVRNALSQKEVANKIRVTQTTISNWERGRGAPSEKEAAGLERILAISTTRDSSAEGSALAAWLTKERLSRKWSIPELADKAGLTPPALYRIEAGITRNLREATRKKLEDAFGGAIPEETVSELAEEAEVAGIGRLEDFDPHDDSDRPTGSGIYVLYDISERPIYVGEGSNVRKRIKDHEEKFWFKRPIVETASWIQIDDGTLRQQIETLLIKFLKSNAVINKQNVEREA